MAISIALAAIVFLAVLSGYAAWRAERTAPPIGRFAKINGQTLHYLDTGEHDHATQEKADQAVILIHGASVNLRDMAMSLGEPLSANRRVVMIDRPGRGYSTRPQDGYRLDVQAQMIKALADQLGLVKPIVVGQSYGGAVALSYGLQYSGEISGLVLLATVSHEWPGGVAWYNHLSQTPILGFFFRRLVIPIYGAVVAPRSIEQSFAPNQAPENYAERAGLSLLFRPSDFKNSAADVATLKAQIVEQQLRYNEISAPVEIITGDADDTVSPELHSKALARQVDGARLTVLEQTGHALHHARTAEILGVIEALAATAAKDAAGAATRPAD